MTAAATSRTAVAMVTIGPDSYTRRYSVRRAKAYAARHGYDFVQVSEPSQPESGRTPHWEKLLVPKAHPDYDRWLIIDDDVLINTRVAPALPELAPGRLGMVKEPVPTKFAPPMEWLGNSGVLLFDRAALNLIDGAYEMGEYKEIVPGFGDQPAVNFVAWRAGQVERLEWKWNYMVMADWLTSRHRQIYPWTNNIFLARWAKVTFYTSLRRALHHPPAEGPLARLRQSHFVHLIWFRMAAGLVDRYLG